VEVSLYLRELVRQKHPEQEEAAVYTALKNAANFEWRDGATCLVEEECPEMADWMAVVISANIGEVEKVKRLEAAVNFRPVVMAAKTGNVETIKRLLASSARPKCTVWGIREALCGAAMNGHLEVLKQMTEMLLNEYPEKASWVIADALILAGSFGGTGRYVASPIGPIKYNEHPDCMAHLRDMQTKARGKQ
jgi:hypothetical protein